MNKTLKFMPSLLERAQQLKRVRTSLACSDLHLGLKSNRSNRRKSRALDVCCHGSGDGTARPQLELVLSWVLPDTPQSLLTYKLTSENEFAAHCPWPHQGQLSWANEERAEAGLSMLMSHCVQCTQTLPPLGTPSTEQTFWCCHSSHCK